MPAIALLQVASIIATVVLYRAYPVSTSWYSLVFSLGFSHYLLALIYSHRQIRQVGRQTHSIAPALAVLALGTVLYINNVPLYVYFGIHHVFNEVYLRRRSILRTDTTDAIGLSTSGIFLHFAAYFLLLRAKAITDSGYLPVVLTGLIIATVAYFYYLRRMQASLSAAKLIDLCAFEVIVLALVPVAFFYKFTLQQIVCYHFVFWALFPMVRLIANRKIPSIALYSALTIGSFMIFYTISPLGPPTLQISLRTFLDQFILWSYIHITISFILSSSHPEWIARWFRPRERSLVGA